MCDVRAACRHTIAQVHPTILGPNSVAHTRQAATHFLRAQGKVLSWALLEIKVTYVKVT